MSMKSETIWKREKNADSPASSAPFPARPGMIARFLQRRLSGFEAGRIVIELPDGSQVTQTGRLDGPRAYIAVRRWRTLWRLFAQGDVGLARSYFDGDWTTNDLSAVLSFGAENSPALEAAANGSRLAHCLNRLRHGARRNSRRGSRRNIMAHYDLGNRFYQRWLDDGMQYSSAIYRAPDETLEAAQARKLDRIVELMDVRGGERVLEIGCGWGAVCERLAVAGDCSVTALTLSREQADYARRRMAAVGRDERVSVELRDYRDVDGQFDRIVSIEMFEAVGMQYWPAYFSRLAQCLKDGGSALLQVITIDERHFEAYRARPDFIQTFIFPGGMLPTKSALREEAERAGLRLVHQECFGKSYQHTLAAWRKRFFANWSAIEGLGFDLRFQRMWEYYLRYCETGFGRGSIDVGFYKFAK